jgi:lipopolysaccharide biosynthesis glycosyltransferase
VLSAKEEKAADPSQSPPKQLMAVAFSVDANYALAAAVAIASLRERTPPELALEIWVVHSGLGDEDMALLARAASRSRATLRTVRISDYRLNLPVRSDYISAATFGRLYLGEILPVRIGRVLYLDCDLLVTGDLTPLWETDLRGHIVAAVPEATTAVVSTPKTYEHPLDPKLNPSDPYFNAGVLLIDLMQWRRFQVGERAVEYIRKYRPPLMDQDALNSRLVGAWMALDRRWNVTTYWFRSPSRQKRYQALLRRARIVHYVGHRKPWLRPDVWMGRRWHAHRLALEAVSGHRHSRQTSASAETFARAPGTRSRTYLVK